MLKRLPKIPILLLTAGVLLFSWYWSSSNPPSMQQANLEQEPAPSQQQNLVSAIQPVSTAEAVAVAPFAATEEFTSRFQQANSYASGDDTNLAKLHYQDLIRDYPRAIESYVNLAALYAQESQLDKAQKTLTEGLNANQSYAALFANLQKILGALAANAYKDALQEESGKITTLQLPLLQTVSSGGASSQQLSMLRKQLKQAGDAAAEAKKTALMSAAEQKKIIDLQAELNTTRLSLQILEDEYQAKLASVQAKLDEQILAASNLAAENQKQQSEIALAQQLVVDKQAELDQAERDAKAEQQTLALALEAEREAKAKQQALALEQQAERDAQAKQQALALAQQEERDAKAKQQALALAQQEERDAKAKQQALALAQQAEREAKAKQQALALAQQAEREAQAEQQALALALQEERDAKAKQQALALAQQQAQQEKLEEWREKLRTQAVAHVNRWAQAWSNQSVDDYVASYAEGYAPEGRGLSHQQWLEQRRVRLTNKSFIDVDVRDFKVAKTAQGFDVTFLQHYKADNIDDRIRKRLSFAAASDEWANAKIIRETIIK